MELQRTSQIKCNTLVKLDFESISLDEFNPDLVKSVLVSTTSQLIAGIEELSSKGFSVNINPKVSTIDSILSDFNTKEFKDFFKFVERTLSRKEEYLDFDDIYQKIDYLKSFHIKLVNLSNDNEGLQLFRSIIDLGIKISKGVELALREVSNFLLDRDTSSPTFQETVVSILESKPTTKAIKSGQRAEATQISNALIRALNLADEIKGESAGKTLNLSKVPSVVSFGTSTKRISSPSGTNVVADNTNGLLKSYMAIDRALVPVSLDGKCISFAESLDTAIQVIPELSSLKVKKIEAVQGIIDFGAPKSNQADIWVSVLGGTNPTIEIPYGFKVVAYEFKTFFNFNISSKEGFKRELLGVHRCLVPKGAKKLNIRIEKDDNKSILSEEDFKNLLKVNTDFDLLLNPLLFEQVEKSRNANIETLSQEERKLIIMDIAHAFDLQNTVYSDSAFLRILDQKAKLNFTHFLNGSNIGNCERLSMQLCLIFRAAGFPAFLIGGSCLEGLQYMNKPGHMQLVVFTPKPFLFDATTGTCYELLFDETKISSETKVKCSGLDGVTPDVAVEIAKQVRKEGVIAIADPMISGLLITDKEKNPSKELIQREWELSFSDKLIGVMEKALESKDLVLFRELIFEGKDYLKYFADSSEKANSQRRKIGSQIFDAAVCLLNNNEFDAATRSACLEELFKELGESVYSKRSDLIVPFLASLKEGSILELGGNNFFLRVQFKFLKNATYNEVNKVDYLQVLQVLSDASIKHISHQINDAKKLECSLMRVYYECYQNLQNCNDEIDLTEVKQGIINAALKADAASEYEDIELLISLVSIPKTKNDNKSFLNFLKLIKKESLIEILKINEEIQLKLIASICDLEDLFEIIKVTKALENILGFRIDFSANPNKFNREKLTTKWLMALPESKNPFSRWVFLDETRAVDSNLEPIVAAYSRGLITFDSLQNDFQLIGEDRKAFASFIKSISWSFIDSNGSLIIKSKRKNNGLIRINAGLLFIASIMPQVFSEKEGGTELIYIAKKISKEKAFRDDENYQSFLDMANSYPEDFLEFAKVISSYFSLDNELFLNILKSIDVLAPKIINDIYYYGIAASESLIMSERAGTRESWFESRRDAVQAIKQGDITRFEEVVLAIAKGTTLEDSLINDNIGMYFLFDYRKEKCSYSYSPFQSMNRYWKDLTSPFYELKANSSVLDEVWYRVVMDAHYFRSHTISLQRVKESVLEDLEKLPMGRRQKSNSYLVELEGGNIKTPSWTDNFLSYRNFTPGDDLRLLDYRALLRLDKYYVKQFGAKPPSEEALEKIVILTDMNALVCHHRQANFHTKQIHSLVHAAINEGKKVEVHGFFRGCNLWSMPNLNLNIQNLDDTESVIHLYRRLWRSGYDTGITYARAWDRTYPITSLFSSLPLALSKDLQSKSKSSTLFVFACSPTVMATTFNEIPELKGLNTAHMKDFRTVNLSEVINL